MNADRRDAAQAHDEHYQEVSLRAVELLAKAQRAADEAVAEAQSYARDLEASAREQYRQILQRAQAAAQEGAPGAGAASAAGSGAGAASAAGSGAGPGAAGQDGGALDRGTLDAGTLDAGTLDARQLMYVRTYARVAHAQLTSVLAALNGELDQLAAIAEGSAGPPTAPGPGDRPAAPGPAADTPSASTQHAPPTIPSITQALHPPREGDKWAPGVTRASRPARATEERTWPPIFAATNAISYVFPGSSSDGPEA